MTVYLLHLSFDDVTRDVRPFADIERAREFARSTFRRGAPVLTYAKVEHWVPTASGLAMAKAEEIPDGRGRWEDYTTLHEYEHRFFYDGGAIRIVRPAGTWDWDVLSEVGGFGRRRLAEKSESLDVVKSKAIELVRQHLSESLKKLEAAIV